MIHNLLSRVVFFITSVTGAQCDSTKRSLLLFFSHMYRRARFDNNPKRTKGSSLQARNRVILSREPLCRVCKELGLVSRATEIDHIVPLHKGGSDDVSNLQPLCSECHNVKSITERGGKVVKSRNLQGLDWI